MDTVTTRKPARSMLALVALATDLPMPTSVRFRTNTIDGTPIIEVGLRSIAEGLEWAAHFGITAKPYTYSDKYLYLGAQNTTERWHGWLVDVDAVEDVADPADEITDERAALTELAEAAGQ